MRMQVKRQSGEHWIHLGVLAVLAGLSLPLACGGSSGEQDQAKAGGAGVSVDGSGHQDGNYIARDGALTTDGHAPTDDGAPFKDGTPVEDGASFQDGQPTSQDGSHFSDGHWDGSGFSDGHQDGGGFGDGSALPQGGGGSGGIGSTGGTSNGGAGG